MIGRAPLWLILALLLGGCAAPADKLVDPSGTAGPESPLPTVPSTITDARPVSPRLGLNLTACEGSESGAGVPSAWVQDFLPDGFEPATDPTTNVQIDFYSCGKVALDGVDVGPASFLFMRVAIQEPAGAPPGDHQGSLYAVEFRSDNAAVASWATRGLLQGGLGTVVHSFDPAPDPGWWGTVDSSVQEGDAPLYHITAVPEKTLERRETVYRWYFDTNPLNFWEVRTVAQHSAGDGDGIFEAAEGSPFSALTKGATRYYTLTAAENAEYRMLLPVPASGE